MGQVKVERRARQKSSKTGIHPSRQTRLTWQPRQLAVHEVSEGLPRHVVVGAVAVHKVHWYIQNILDVPLKTKPFLKHKRQSAAAAHRMGGGVGSAPRMVNRRERPSGQRANAAARNRHIRRHAGFSPVGVCVRPHVAAPAKVARGLALLEG